MTDPANLFVSAEWLAGHLGDASVAIVDASWYLPSAGRDARAEFRAAHIPGAVFFDIDAISDTSSPLPHMLPSPEAFGAAAGALGIAETQTIVVYDGAGLFSAPRAWWTFRTFGAPDVRILEGGFPQWRKEAQPVESGEARPARQDFLARFDATAVAAVDDVRALAGSPAAQIVDARAADRFRGEAAEPRAGVRSGHIPGSRNVPFGELVENGRLKPLEAVRAVFEDAGIDPSQPVLTSCGSGVTAAVLTLALTALGSETVRLYDGSWAEWGSRQDLPIATGPA